MTKASQSRYADPTAFIPSSIDGTASSAADKPVPDTATSSASVRAIPPINGRLRKNPNCAPDAVAKDVAPPGDPVDTTANKTSARNVSVKDAPYFSTLISREKKIKKLILVMSQLELLMMAHDRF